MILWPLCHSGWLMASVQSWHCRLIPARFGYVPFPCFLFKGIMPTCVSVWCQNRASEDIPLASFQVTTCSASWSVKRSSLIPDSSDSKLATGVCSFDHGCGRLVRKVLSRPREKAFPLSKAAPIVLWPDQKSYVEFLIFPSILPVGNFSSSMSRRRPE